MERRLSDGRQKLAAELGKSDSDVLVRTGNQESDLYDEYDRIAEYDFAKDYQEPGNVPVGRSSL